LDFYATLAPEEKTYYYLEDGGQGNTSQSQLTVTETEDQIKVDTGKIQFSIHKKHFNLFDEVNILHDPAGGQIISPASAKGIVLTDVNDKTYTSYYSPPEEIRVEEQGPLRTTILVWGGFASAQGEAFLPEVARYTVRIVAYRGQDFVHLFFTFENNGRYGFRHDKAPNESFEFKELALKLGLNLASPRYIQTQDYGDKYRPDERFFLYQRHT